MSDATQFLEQLRGGPLTFGSLVRSLREADEVPLADIAIKLGLTPEDILEVENGVQTVDKHTAARWAAALGYPPAVFVRLASPSCGA
jgi:transcriptional regulator with XRE-family HTH domain